MSAFGFPSAVPLLSEPIYHTAILGRHFPHFQLDHGSAPSAPTGNLKRFLLRRWLRVLLPLRPLPGGRRSAAAPTGLSDCAGFAPNYPLPRLALTALSLTPC